VAIHRAVEEIQFGNCNMAIAGGINIIASPSLFISLSKAGMLCEDGRCKTFDKSADGYVRGEGVGVVLLKPLKKAIEDKDNIYGVIKGSHINHGGHVNSLTTPNPNAQAEVIVKAWEKAQVDPTTVSYIEAHGTGTRIGDSIEINGLKKAFDKLLNNWDKKLHKDAYCGIGSVKTNIGHLETAAGIAGLMKVILAMKKRIIPASINMNELNPYIELEGSPFYLVDRTKRWDKEDGQPRRAGISSFGFGGTNAHVVIEEYEFNVGSDNISNTPELIVLSAKNETRLKEYAKSMLKYINNELMNKNHNINLKQTAHTLQVGREPMNERLAIITSNSNDLQNKINSYLIDENIENVYVGKVTTNNKKTLLFIQTKEGQEFLKTLMYNKNLGVLAQIWVEGGEIDWKLLYGNKKIRRISLPTYPFANESYWIPKEKIVTKIDKLPLKAIEETKYEVKNEILYLTNEWENNELIEEDDRNILSLSTLLLMDTGAELFNVLKEKNIIENIIFVKQGQEYKELNDKEYIVNITKSEDYKTLIKTLKNKKLLPSHIIHFWSKGYEKNLNKQLERSVYSIYNLSRELIKQKPEKSIKTIYVYSTEENNIIPQYEAVSGLLKTISLESTKIFSKSLGLDIDEPTDICNILISELSKGDKEVKYKNGNRLIKKINEIQQSEEIFYNSQSLLKNNGVYIITGGAGGLGLIFAKYLVKNIRPT
jgi:acyl transferase domain-containing protein